VKGVAVRGPALVAALDVAGEVTIFIPKLDEDGSIAPCFVKALCDGIVARSVEIRAAR
jgi:hypothetical protein